METVLAILLTLLSVAVIILCLAVYMLPTVIAVWKKEKNVFFIFIINLLTGWTTIGWVASLLWSIYEKDGDDLIEKLR